MREWNEEQKKAIENRNKNLLVSAAAGSGKTAVLVERICRLVIDEGAGIDRMLIVTFTRAAASEMKEKIYKSLSAAYREKDIDKRKKEELLHQLSLMPRANISTFDSFAGEIVKNYYHIIGLNPGLRICDEGKCSIIKNEVMEALFEKEFSDPGPEFLKFLNCYSKAADFGKVQSMIYNLDSFIQTLPDPEGYLKKALSPAAGEELISFAAKLAAGRLKLAKKYFEAAAKLLADSKLSRLEALVKEDVSIAESLMAPLLKEAPEDKAFAALSEKPKYPRMSSRKEENAEYDLIKDKCTILISSGKNLIKKAGELSAVSRQSLLSESEYVKPALKELFRLTLAFEDAYLQRMQKEGLMDFSQCVHYALGILKNEKVSSEYREKFRYIFIDEYQDSNSVQEALISAIARENNLFMVGDVKQSIYRFRLADPDIFISKYKAYKENNPEGQSEVIDLNKSYRSKSGIIKCVNRLFNRLMTEESCGIAYDASAELIKGCSYTGDLEYDPKMYILNNSVSSEDTASCEPAASEEENGKIDEEISELKNTEMDALQCVYIIKKYLGKEIFDNEKNEVRPLEYKDMAILLRFANEAGEVYYNALKSAGIPVSFERTAGFYDAIEIKVILNLLRLIDNGGKDIPLLSLLVSPIFGFNSEELAKIRIHSFEYEEKGKPRLPYNKAFALYADRGSDEELRKKCRAFQNKLQSWRLRSHVTALGDFINQLISETGYRDYCVASEGGAQKLNNLRTLASNARAYESENPGGLYGFISYIDALYSRGKMPAAGQALSSSGQNCVKIMTVHKSKGLEFPFVLLANMCAKGNNKDKKGICDFHKDLGVGLRMVNPENGIYTDPIILQLIRARREEEERAELIRLLYVAFTRAKDILVLSAVYKAKKDKLESIRSIIPGDAISPADFAEYVLSNLPFLDIHKTGIMELSMEEKEKKDKAEELSRLLCEGFGSDAPSEELSEMLFYPYTDGVGDKLKTKYSVSQLAEIMTKGTEAPHVTCKEAALPNKPASGEYSYELPDFVRGSSKLNSAARGTAYHKLMQHIPFAPEYKKAGKVSDFINSLVNKHILTLEEAKTISPGKIAGFFKSPLGIRVTKAKEVYKEAPFIMKHLYNGREVLVQGTIDCYFKEEDGFVLVDYKSNYIDPAAGEEAYKKLRENYLPQLQLYREALEKITGVKVKEAVLYLFGTGEELRLS